jgi:hypothetical protein
MWVGDPIDADGFGSVCADRTMPATSGNGMNDSQFVGRSVNFLRRASRVAA